MSEGPQASIPGQGSNVGPGGGGGSVLSPPPKKKCRDRAEAPGTEAPPSQLAAGRPGAESFTVRPEGPPPCRGHSSREVRELRCRCSWLGVQASGARESSTPAQSWAASARHLRAWSLCASGRIWLRIPPSRLDVASVARMRGFTTVGGSWRITPPTAPVSPFCS